MSRAHLVRTRRQRSAMILLLIATAGGAARGDEIDRYAEEALRRLQIPGLSLAIVRDGTIVKSQGYGFADLQHRVPATPGTVYEIGSTSKQFTGALVMMLVEQGKLRLDDPLTTYFPKAPEWWSRITVRHLLTHTGGIQNHVAVPGYLARFKSDLFFQGSPPKEELLAMFYELPREFEPGATWAYDNTGYLLLGWILEQASGTPYWQLLQERIFGPLGMTASRSTDPRPLVPNRAAGYGWAEGGFENRNVLWPHVAFSAGSILSTVEDLARWDAALRGDALLTSRSRELLWTAATAADGTPLPFDYGFGWFTDSFHGHRVVQHSGGTPGFSSTIYRYPDDHLAVLILANHGDRILDHLAIDIAGMVEPALRRPERIEDPEPQTTARLRAAFADLLQGKHDPAQFTPAMALYLQTATGKASAQWFAEHGELGSFTLADHERRGDDRVLRYAVVLGGNRYWFSFRLAPDGKIAQTTWW